MGNRFIESIKSEPLKWVPIGLSLLPMGISLFSLLVSFLGWREAHKARLMSEGVNRPVVTVEASSKAIASALKEGPTQIVKTVAVTSEIKNHGKTSAVINKIEHSIDTYQECLLSTNQPWTEDHEAEFKALVGKEVPPSLSLNAVQLFAIRPQCPYQNILLVSHGIIYYTDTVTGIPYVQDFSNSVIVPDPTAVPSASIGRP